MNKDSTTFTEADWAEVGVRILEKSMARGHLAAVRGTLSSIKWMTTFQLLGPDRMTDLLDRSRGWLREGEAYEAIHGADSLMNRDDPFTSTILRAHEDVRAMAKRRSERLDGSNADGSCGDRLGILDVGHGISHERAVTSRVMLGSQKSA